MSDQTTRSDDPLHPDELERSQRRVRRHAHRAKRRRAQRIVYVVVLMAAIAAAFAQGEPTGLTGLDIAYRSLFAAFVTIAAARAKRWTWFVLAGTAGAVGSEQWLPLGLACAALFVGFASLQLGRRQRELGAVVGALAAQSLLWLPTDLPFATPTIAAAVVTVVVALSALRNLRRPRRYVWAGLGVLALLVVIGIAFVAGMFTIASHAQDGVTAANRGLEAASKGDDAVSTDAFTVADREFRAAADTASVWWLTPARAVPVLAQHVEAARSLATEGRSLASLGAEQAAVLDVRGLSSPNGGLDLARIADLAPVAAEVADALERADRALDATDSPWLVSPVTDRIDQFEADVAAVAPTARNAADALALAPELLGRDRPQAYLTLVGNPAESRELGGFVAAVGVLTADDGRLDFDSLEASSTLNRRARDADVSLDLELPPYYVGSAPERFVQNWANTPDFPLVTDVAAHLGPSMAGTDVDGVLYVDPYVVAAVLQLTGPVSIEGRAEPLAPADAVDHLLRDQYLSDDFDDNGERKERLRDAAEAAFEELTSTSLPDPRRFANRLSPLVQARRLLFSTTAPGPHELLARVGLRPPVDLGTADQLLLTQENLRANKLDAYLERSITYDVDIDDDGTATGTVTVELTNTAPAEGLPPYVTGDGTRVREDEPLAEALSRINLDLYSRLEGVGVTIDGEPSGYGSTTVSGLFRTNTRVEIPPASTVTVVYEVAGTLDADDYVLVIVPNATAATDEVTATIGLAGEDLTLEPTPLRRSIRVGRNTDDG